jgi:hypothetical protein
LFFPGRPIKEGGALLDNELVQQNVGHFDLGHRIIYFTQ